MPLELREHLHWCACAGRAVFLDVEADRYFCLPHAANDAFMRLAAGQATDDQLKPLRGLIARGLLKETGSGDPIPSAPSTQNPVRELVAEPAPRSGPVALLRALASEIHAAWLLRHRTFRQVISLAQERGSRCPRPSGEPERQIESIVAAADIISFVTRAHDRCLVRALAVHAVCTSKGIRPKLVFGVIAHPFAAHCWVQLGDAVLVGGAEQARLYTPILVVE